MRQSALMPIFNRLPVSFEYGQGSWLFDKTGKKYLDAATGIGVSSLGHAHPAIVSAVIEQAKKVIHITNQFVIEQQEQLAHELTQFAGLDKAIFVSTGTEATEASLKMARLYGHSRNVERPTLIVFEGGFHGRTLGALSASGNYKLQQGFDPLLPGFIFLPYNDLDAIHKLIANDSKNIVGICLEPILGQGGVIIPDENYLPSLRKLCDQHDWILLLDEIQTGMARTGKPFAYQHYDLKPDIMTTAKTLANGLPIGALMANDKCAALFTEGKHGTTFGGNPLSCAAALALLKTYREENIVENVTRMGDYLLKQLQTELTNKRGVVDVRGKGLMLGVELDKTCYDIYHNGLEHGLLFNITANNVIRLLPPYNITQQEVDLLVSKLVAVLTDYYP